MMAAAKEGHTKIVQQLLEGGADLTHTDKDGDTALMYAVYDNRVEVVKVLTQAGASPNQTRQV